MASPSASSSGKPLNVTMYPNDGTTAKPIVVAISDRSLSALISGMSKAASSGGLGGGSTADAEEEKRKDSKGMLKHLAGIGVLAGLLKTMVANSQVLNAYQSAMGKTFGAVMDMLMLPLTPIFNLILVGLNKLVIWLISSGVLKKIQNVMEQVAKNIESVAKFFYNLFRHIIKGEWKEAAHMIVQGIKDAIGGIFGSKTKMAAAALTPSMALAAGGFMLGGPALAAKGFMLPLALAGKPLGAGIGWGWSKTGGALWNKFGWGGGGGTPPIVPPGGGGGAGGLGMPMGGAGMFGNVTMGSLAIAGGVAIAGQALGWGIEKAFDKAGHGDSKWANIGGSAARWGGAGAAIGGALGAGVFSIPGAAIGGAIGATLGATKGYFDWKNKQGAGGEDQQAALSRGGSINNSNNKNSYNTINVSINMMTTNGNQAINEVIQAAEKKTGYQMHSGTGTFSGYGLSSRNTISWKQATIMSVPGLPLAAKAVGMI